MPRRLGLIVALFTLLSLMPGCGDDAAKAEYGAPAKYRTLYGATPLRYPDFVLRWIKRTAFEGLGGGAHFVNQVFEFKEQPDGAPHEVTVASQAGVLAPAAFHANGKDFLLYASFFKVRLRSNEVVVIPAKDAPINR